MLVEETLRAVSERIATPAEKLSQESTAAVSTTISLLVEEAAPATGNLRPGPNRRRGLSPEAGHALLKLGHAIEYLSDELVQEGGSFSANDPRIQAVRLLMAVNRQIYFACPEVSTLIDRFVSIFRL